MRRIPTRANSTPAAPWKTHTVVCGVRITPPVSEGLAPGKMFTKLRNGPGATLVVHNDAPGTGVLLLGKERASSIRTEEDAMREAAAILAENRVAFASVSRIQSFMCTLLATGVKADPTTLRLRRAARRTCYKTVHVRVADAFTMDANVFHHSDRVLLTRVPFDERVRAAKAAESVLCGRASDVPAAIVSCGW